MKIEIIDKKKDICTYFVFGQSVFIAFRCMFRCQYIESEVEIRSRSDISLLKTINIFL